MFSVLGGAAPIPCTAAGINTITLTPITNNYLPASYSNYQPIIFTASNTSNGPVTVRLGALAFVKLFTSGLQASAGDIVSAQMYMIAFNANLDSGNGGFQILNVVPPSVIQPVRGTSKNLIIQNGGTPDNQVSVTADEVMLENASGGAARVSNISLTISTGTSGANGLDAGSIASNTFYSVWVIYNGTVISGLLSLSATSPALPGGYTYSARVGWVRTGAASTNLHRILQKGPRAQYQVTPASQTTALPIIASPLGTPYTAQSVTPGFVPSTAQRIQGMLTAGFSANAGFAAIAPNNNYATSGAGSSPYPPVAMTLQGVVGIFNSTFDLLLESTNIYTGQTGISTTALCLCLGWEDNNGT
jgi:hypothetical protein